MMTKRYIDLDKMAAALIFGPILLMMKLLSGGLAAWFNVFVAWKLWGWFIEPTFNVPTPSVLMVYGLLLIARFATDHHLPDTDRRFAVRVVHSLSRSTAFLVWGWAASIFVDPHLVAAALLSWHA